MYIYIVAGFQNFTQIHDFLSCAQDYQNMCFYIQEHSRLNLQLISYATSIRFYKMILHQFWFKYYLRRSLINSCNFRTDLKKGNSQQNIVLKELSNNFLFFFFNWDSPHARLNSHCEAWSYKKRSTKKITGYRKRVQKEPTVKICFQILTL